MKKSVTKSAIVLGLLCGSFALTACQSTTQTQQSAFTGQVTPKRRMPKGPTGPIDDHAMCEWKGIADRETSEVAGPGSLKPNVRRVYLVVGVGEDRKRTLICREIDTNFDGVKDVVRRYNDKGESLHEESDSNYDGKIDTWITFAKGRLAEMRLDNNNDGKADEWKSYSEGRLARIKRDTNGDGKPDVWEIYREGKLERMGVDIDADERVDRWDHDTELRRKLEEAERKKEEEAAKKEADKRAAAEKEAEDDAAEAPSPKSPEGKGSEDKGSAPKP